jgi:hypothetical protein
MQIKGILMIKIIEKIKVNNSDREGLLDIVGIEGGIVKASYWTNDGNYKKKLPLFCIEESNDNNFNANENSMITNEKIKEFYEKNPRVKLRIRFIGTEEEYNKIINNEHLFRDIYKTQKELDKEEKEKKEKLEKIKNIKTSEDYRLEYIRKNCAKNKEGKKTRNTEEITKIDFQANIYGSNTIFNSIPDLSFFPNLEHLEIGGKTITKIEGLDNCLKLKTLIFDYTDLKKSKDWII